MQIHCRYMSCHCLSINCMNPKRQLLIALASSVNAMQQRNPPQQILIHNPKMSCRVTLLIQLLDSGHPKYPYALLASGKFEFYRRQIWEDAGIKQSRGCLLGQARTPGLVYAHSQYNAFLHFIMHSLTTICNCAL